MVDEQIVVDDESIINGVVFGEGVFAKENSKLEEVQLFDKMPELDNHAFVAKETEHSHVNFLWKSNSANAQGAEDLGRRPS